MFYRPKFCCNCGEKIERTDWRLWTSRRFCGFCEVEQMPYDLTIKSVACIIVVFGVFSVANTWFFRSPSGGKSISEPQVVTQPARLAGSVDRKVHEDPNSNDRTANEQQNSPKMDESNVSAANTASAAFKQTQKHKKSSDEPIYFCGAMTKKGSPCTRRVKSPGRCWQHAGKPSILPSNSS